MLWPVFLAVGCGIAYWAGRRRGWDTSKIILVGVVGGLGSWLLIGFLLAAFYIFLWESTGK